MYLAQRSVGRDLMEAKVQLIILMLSSIAFCSKKDLSTAPQYAGAKLCNFSWKMNSQHSTEVFSVSIWLWSSLSLVNSPPRCFLDQNTLLAHRLGLFSFLLQFYNLHSLSLSLSPPLLLILSIPSIGNLSASHLRHPIPARQLHRVLNKHKQRMEWLLER